ncbi:MAG: hypothetical protein ACUVV5_07105 [Candidatus Aminicenantales bacterium]
MRKEVSDGHGPLEQHRSSDHGVQARRWPGDSSLSKFGNLFCCRIVERKIPLLVHLLFSYPIYLWMHLDPGNRKRPHDGKIGVWSKPSKYRGRG